MKTGRVFALTVASVVSCASVVAVPRALERPQAPPPAAAEPIALRPTNHPRLPADLSQLWFAPTSGTPANKTLATAVKLEVDSQFTKALPLLSQASARQGALGPYAIYYQGFAELRLGRAADARRAFQNLRAQEPVGYLAEAAALREAEADEALGDNRAAVDVYDALVKTKLVAPEDVLMRLGRAARSAGNIDKATEAFLRVVYEFPFSDVAAQASAELESLPAGPIAPGTTRYKLELGRAERLFGAKRYAPARQAFEGLRAAAQADDRELIDLRLAESDYYLKHPRNARDELKPYTEKASRQGEALYFYAIAANDLGDHDEYLRLVRRIVDEFPNQSWAEEALNNLATYYIRQNDDAQADATFREMYDKFPTGHYAERAAWKVGWWAYKNGRYADAARAFESGAASFPRSDYRPAWLYWSARAHEALGDQVLAEARDTLDATDYLNTYYGRLALKHLNGRVPERRLIVNAQVAAVVDGSDPSASAGVDAPPLAPAPPNASIVRALLALELYDQALDELRYAQKAWGDSAAIQATLGWIYNRRGDLRAGINAVKRAYPQYMAAGGEQLPTPILKVLFPVSYWPQIRRYSTERSLDPYLIAALILQESNFTADVRSPANAYGLMQILPSTGRQYARTLHFAKKFSISMLTTAETNLRMGTAYFADLVHQFGGVHYALATYNAGPNRVARWIAERPGVGRDEFIDDIPFPETQNYVKRILGTAEDYRRLYAANASAADDSVPPPATRAAVTAAHKSSTPTTTTAKKTTSTRKKTTRKKTG